MGIPRVVAASLLLCACGPKAKSADGPGNTSAEPTPLCVDPAQPGGAVVGPSGAEADEQPWMATSEDHVDALEPGWDLMALVGDGGARYAVVVTKGCYLGTCDPHLLRITDGAITARASLPFAETIPHEGDYPFLVTWLAQRGDEVWVGYNIVGAPEPAVGSTTRTYLAAFAPGDLAPRWSAEVLSYPEASSLDTCAGEVVEVDADCDGDGDLVQAMTCNPLDCEPPEGEADSWTRPDYCPEAPAVSHTVYTRGGDGVFTERKGA